MGDILAHHFAGQLCAHHNDPVHADAHATPTRMVPLRARTRARLADLPANPLTHVSSSFLSLCHDYPCVCLLWRACVSVCVLGAWCLQACVLACLHLRWGGVGWASACCAHVHVWSVCVHARMFTRDRGCERARATFQACGHSIHCRTCRNESGSCN